MNSFRRRFILRRFFLAAGLCWIGTGSFQLSRALDQSVSGNLDVSGELDVHGNSFSLGTWTDNPSSYGMIGTYAEDASHAATFTLTSSRSTSNWLWQKHITGTGTGHVAQMGLSDGNALILYDLATPQNAGIVLDPVNTSSFNTSVSMNGGDNRMPNQTYTGPTSVLTASMADSRYYVRNFNASVTLGINATANPDTSTAIGYGATASGIGSTALGFNSVASGFESTSLARQASASGDFSVAFGQGSVATTTGATALGTNSGAAGVYSLTLGFSSSATGWSAVTIGVGSSAPGIVASAFGPYTTAQGNGSLALGHDAVASSESSSALGIYSRASGVYATALGCGSIASGYLATSLGTSSTASGMYSMAMGHSSVASGNSSTALGVDSNAVGDVSTGIGATETDSMYEVAVGRYNVTGGNPTVWVPTDNLFSVGNGDSPSNPSNAFAVKKNGNTKVSGSLTVVGAIITAQAQGDLSMGEFTAQPSPAP